LKKKQKKLAAVEMLNDEESILKLQQKMIHDSQSTTPLSYRLHGPSVRTSLVRLRITPL
jgi:hypothetical protein